MNTPKSQRFRLVFGGHRLSIEIGAVIAQREDLDLKGNSLKVGCLRC
jgi:hypothetical protein